MAMIESVSKRINATTSKPKTYGVNKKQTPDAKQTMNVLNKYCFFLETLFRERKIPENVN